MPPGSRVRVIKDPEWDGPWREVFAGNISGMAAPDLVEHDLGRPGELAYWVDFDEPQLDVNGDGPYGKAYIWARYLEKGPPPLAKIISTPTRCR